MNMQSSSRRLKRNRYDRQQIPCPCDSCKGEYRSRKTVKLHAATAAAVLAVTENIYNLVSDDAAPAVPVEPQQEAVADEFDFQLSPSQVNQQGPSLDSEIPDGHLPPTAGMSAQAKELIDAYNMFFETCCPGAQIELESGRSQNAEGETEKTITAATLIIMHLDWMDSYNASENSAKHQWDTIRSTLSEHDADAVGKFSMIKNFVEHYRLATAKKIDMCPCTETIYYDLKDARLRRKFPHIKDTDQDHCEKCQKSRYVLHGGVSKPRKSFWYLPYRYTYCTFISLIMHKSCTIIN
jgi:hypothetical protein